MNRWKPITYLLAIGFSGCAPLVAIRQVIPVAPISGNPRLDVAVKIQRTDPHRAVGEELAIADDAYHALLENPKDAGARRCYNFAVARVVDAVGDQDLEPWKKPIPINTPKGEMVLTGMMGRDPDRNPSNYDLVTADRMLIRGAYFQKRMTVVGVGAPLVAVSRNIVPVDQAKSAGRQIYGTVTALITFEAHRATLRFAEPLAAETVMLEGRKFTLAADYTAAPALLMARVRPEKVALARLLRPEKYADTARLTRLQAYDPNRIPVIFVHGLQDTPASWSQMINELRGDPSTRRRYQFWVYSYPSGYPYPYSAALFREALDSVQREFPNHKPIVLVGHSMGGLVSRLMVTDSGDQLWRVYFGKSPAETRLPAKSREILEKTLVFNHRSEVRRVIFMSTPHRGSNLASIWFGRIASALVHPPSTFIALQHKILPLITADPAAMRLNRMPNSIDTLAPGNRFVLAINKIPITPGIPYHSIIGDRGRGDTPKSSDGVVPYWSSHLDGAESELIVPSGHGSPQNEKAIVEVERILKENRD